MSVDPNEVAASLGIDGLAKMLATIDALDAQLHETRLVLAAQLKAAEIAADPARVARLNEAIEHVKKNPPKPDPPDALERRLAELRRQR